MPKNPAAVALAKARWAGVSAELRSRYMSELAKKSAAALGPKGRKSRAQKANKASQKRNKSKSQAVTPQALVTQS